MGAQLVIEIVRGQGVKELQRDWPHVSREQMLVACWWAGRYGPQKWRRAWGDWASDAEHHLWYSCINVPDPPVASVPSESGVRAGGER